MLSVLATSSTCLADYILNTRTSAVRYSDDGVRLIEYGSSRNPSPNPTPNDATPVLGEAMVSLSLAPIAKLMVVTHDLGSHSLYGFDAFSGLPLYGNQPATPEGKSFWSSGYGPYESRCGSQGCSLTPDGFETTARLAGEVLFHPDGYLYGVGYADLFSGTPNASTYVESRAALMRFAKDFSGGPSVVSVLPYISDSQMSPLDFFTPELLPSGEVAVTFENTNPLTSQPNDRYSYSVDVSAFRSPMQGSFVVPATAIALPRQSLLEKVDLTSSGSPVGSLFTGAFEDGRGNIVVLRAVHGGANGPYGPFTTASLLEFDATTGDFKRTVFSEDLPDQFYDNYYSGGIYIAVPEPTSGVLAACCAAAVLARRHPQVK
ncbi:hypothetical protein [Botrimarina mediterranea]|uniref:hypothetical protein n=1 Tax=Botrimarina mediterranea TaxID=2528022 RepID=UPI0011A407F7|nr:hypothetical protein [Botrimarina mediterranea]